MGGAGGLAVQLTVGFFFRERGKPSPALVPGHRVSHGLSACLVTRPF